MRLLVGIRWCSMLEAEVVRRRRRGDLAVVTGIDPVAAVVPLVVPAVRRLGYDQPDSVVQEIRRVHPEPRAPSGMANAERMIGNVSVCRRHGLRIGRGRGGECPPVGSGNAMRAGGISLRLAWLLPRHATARCQPEAEDRYPAKHDSDCKSTLLSRPSPSRWTASIEDTRQPTRLRVGQGICRMS